MKLKREQMKNVQKVRNGWRFQHKPEGGVLK